MRALVIGLLTFLVSLTVMLKLVGPVTCFDGWHSPSIGRRGACSWHGGVDSTPQSLAFAASVFAGFLAYKLATLQIHGCREGPLVASLPKICHPEIPAS